MPNDLIQKLYKTDWTDRASGSDRRSIVFANTPITLRSLCRLIRLSTSGLKTFACHSENMPYGIASFAVKQLSADLSNISSTGHMTMGAPRKGQGGSPDPPGFRHKFFPWAPLHRCTRVEIQMHFWKGAKFSGSVRHPMTKMLSASGGLPP